MAKRTARPRDAGVRDRLLDTADRLFYKEGIRAVGIDRVLDEAGAAKASLYSHFGSKDDLVAAYIEGRVLQSREVIEGYLAPYPMEERARRFFDWVVEWAESDGFCGCPMMQVTGEIKDAKHPARAIAAGQRDWLDARMHEWVKAAGATHPQELAGALLVLFDGAAAASVQDGPKRARDARWAAHRLLGV